MAQKSCVVGAPVHVTLNRTITNHNGSSQSVIDSSFSLDLHSSTPPSITHRQVLPHADKEGAKATVIFGL